MCARGLSFFAIVSGVGYRSTARHFVGGVGLKLILWIERELWGG